ncbi:metallophosphoesterase [Aureivirga marina]|uniref:metallophosphoesterase n=1 Tax=Aureivirga marina TaxID=1182451 RepID=UPI0018CB3DD9|nr:metallophosphoesterase [Aureivirga marina]
MGIAFFIGFLLVFLGIDIYILRVYFRILESTLARRVFQYLYVITGIIAYVGVINIYLSRAVFENESFNASIFKNVTSGVFFAFFIFKLLLASYLFIYDLYRYIKYIILRIKRKKGERKVNLKHRRKFIGQLGLIAASVPFASMIYGITKGKYLYTVKNVNLKLKNLPDAFKGFKIVHISDVHAGSFDSKEDVQRGIDLINTQNPDAVFFTGDLVNNDAREITDYVDIFKSINSKYGKFSCLGNHDYGDYKNWGSEEAKQQNMQLLFQQHKDMNFELLNNESRRIHKDGEFIDIVGVENWGSLGRFPKIGDLDKALTNTENESFKILMSHDPTHWDEKVLEHQTHIDLTLSGHTHGMQFGIEIPGFKWSPSKFIYPRWAGLYEEKNQFLYVNRGFGFLGFPGRVGIWPEITVIELS